ncbi:hypothetical protein Fmac_004469 [Flemingia macrophylla]|uniref:Uncharacterized protein n=1 Tax=Flemingia macrophylla TaxID=520843 RepID=A0ABD1N572_9FABA
MELLSSGVSYTSLLIAVKNHEKAILAFLHWEDDDKETNESMKSRIMATYPDAFPEDSMNEVIDRRPDLEMPK